MKTEVLITILLALLVITVPAVSANNEANSGAYALDLSTLPESMQAYAEENPESFEANMNELMGQGCSEMEALLEMEQRLMSNLEAIEAEKKHDRFLKEIEAVPNIQRAMVVQDPELYKEAKRKFASGVPITGKEEKLLGIVRGMDGLYRPVSSAHPDHLKGERAYANAIIQYDQSVKEIQSMVQWLQKNCPPKDIPTVNTEYTDDEKPISERRQLVLAEQSRIELFYSFYKRQADERAAVQRRLKEMEAQLSRIQKRLTEIEENQHWH